ncbi:hypothetical protein BDZ94DRAFT_23198 [Collybia nuda]|uniref:Uncharacterized protein n=1 Tax=Collybia nuda TaxID=64659 RepID=A0A9P5YGZ3_9AGAR|nr:hypothetical protein BDZ94DRAFT_23198 [Collybia nuda]
MSEDDRAAKAARAKALLKRRREKAAESAGVSITASHSGVSSPISPPRTFSPAPSEVIEYDKRDLGDVFAKDDSDTSWLTSLPRAATPPPPSERVASPQVLPRSSLSITASLPRSTLTSPQSEDAERVQKQIKSLQAENASLVTEVKQLQASELSA